MRVQIGENFRGDTKTADSLVIFILIRMAMVKRIGKVTILKFYSI